MVTKNSFLCDLIIWKFIYAINSVVYLFLSARLKKSAVGMRVVIGIQVVRYVAMPLSGICVVKAARHFGLVGSDSLYQFVLLLQYALPSAMTIGTIYSFINQH